MSGNPLKHWRYKASGAEATFDYQYQTKDEVIVIQVSGNWDGSRTVHLPKVCMDCGVTRPREGFAPGLQQSRLDRGRGKSCATL